MIFSPLIVTFPPLEFSPLISYDFAVNFLRFRRQFLVPQQTPKSNEFAAIYVRFRRYILMLSLQMNLCFRHYFHTLHLMISPLINLCFRRYFLPAYYPLGACLLPFRCLIMLGQVRPKAALPPVGFPLGACSLSFRCLLTTLQVPACFPLGT